ncbi:MAG TPA: helix-turn-helix domain-containing protein [Longimicrobiales bacterium]|nr:helix-turn-helix domain-containing protein [Longimicrobiales bacterium]
MTERDDLVFRALANPSRRLLLDKLFEDDGQSLVAVCEGLRMTRQAVTQHLAVLEEAGLIATVRQGREKLHYLDTVPIRDLADRWIGKFERSRPRLLRDLEDRVEGNDQAELAARQRVLRMAGDDVGNEDVRGGGGEGGGLT